MTDITKYIPIEVRYIETITYDSIIEKKSNYIEFNNGFNIFSYPTYGGYKIFNIISRGYDENYFVGGAIRTDKRRSGSYRFFNPIALNGLILGGGNIYTLKYGAPYKFRNPLVDLFQRRIYDSIHFELSETENSYGRVDVYGRDIDDDGNVVDEEESKIIKSYEILRSYISHPWNISDGISLYIAPDADADDDDLITYGTRDNYMNGYEFVTGLYSSSDVWTIMDKLHISFETVARKGYAIQASLRYMERKFSTVWLNSIRCPSMYGCYLSGDRYYAFDQRYTFTTWYPSRAMSNPTFYETLNNPYIFHQVTNTYEVAEVQAARYHWTSVPNPEGYDERWITGDVQKFEEGVKYV